MILVWGLAIPVFPDYWSGVFLGDVPTKEPPKNPEKKKRKNLWWNKIDRPKSATGHDRDQTTSRSLGDLVWVVLLNLQQGSKACWCSEPGFQKKRHQGRWGLMSWKVRCHISICSFLNDFLPQVHGYWEWLMCDIGLQSSHHNLVFDVTLWMAQSSTRTRNFW